MRFRRQADGDTAGEQLLMGWGRTAPSRADVVRPARLEQLGAALSGSPARGVIARGMGRSYGDAAQNAGGRVVSTRAISERCDLDPDTGRAWISAGTSLGAVIEHVLPRGWFPAVVPGTQHVSIGGAIAADVHGKNHHRDGSFCGHVRAIELVVPGGARMTLGPEGPDAEAFWATAGGMGLTGIAIAAELQLRPVATAQMRVRITRTRNLEHSMQVLCEADRGAHYTVAWVDLLCGGRTRGRGIVAAGEHAGPEVRPMPIGRGEIVVPRHRRLGSVPAVPTRAGVLHPAAMRVFNELYFRAAPATPVERIESVWSYFFPLDAVGNWNRLYGRAGMLQYQFVIPDSASDRLGAMLERLVADNVPVYLAVLKRLRDAYGPLGFPIMGWTLAIDIPVAVHGLGPALDRLDSAVADCGGRIYLAKDSRLRAELLPVMYPRLAEWRAVRDRLDPGRLMRSDLDRRLSLVGSQLVEDGS